MSDFRIEMRELIEDITKVKVYPTNIPSNAKYPCICMRISGGGRDDSSSLTDTQIRDMRVSLIVCGQRSSDVYPFEKLLIEGMDNVVLPLATTKNLISYFDNSVEIYNHVQGLHELTADFSIKKTN